MSFHIHAAGTRGFVYETDNGADGSEFEATAVMSALAATGPTPLGVVDGIADYVVDSTAGQTRSAAQAGGGIIHAQNLRNAVNMLMTLPGAASGLIAVAAIQDAVFGGYYASRHVIFTHVPGTDTGTEFIRRISPALTATELNIYGVFREMAVAVYLYRSHIVGSRESPMLQIYLRH